MTFKLETVWTIIKLIDWGTTYLKKQNIDDARLNIELMLSKVLNYDRIGLYSNYDQPLSSDELSKLKIMLKRRVASEPLQYILSETYFYGLKFFCRPDVLIPRPETELIIEQFSKIPKSKKFSLLDIGTGTGCIAITIAKFYPEAKVTAIDISEQAIQTAKQNAEFHNVDIELIYADVFDYSFQSPFDFIVSNPPYISLNDTKMLQDEIVMYEPSIAYTDKHDGLTYYRKFAGLVEKYLNRDGKFLFEIGSGQSGAIKDIFKSKIVDVVSDMSSHDRLVVGVQEMLK